jgi:hypothetical protein
MPKAPRLTAAEAEAMLLGADYRLPPFVVYLFVGTNKQTK